MKILKSIFNFIIIPYILLAIFVTICLLNYNDYNITELGKTSLIIMDNSALEPNFNKGDLLLIKRNDDSEIKIGDFVFFYDTYATQVSTSLAQVTERKQINESEVTYTVTGGYSISGEYIIGKSDTTKIYRGMGKVLGVLESRYGFLFIFVVPLLVMFLTEIYIFIMALKEPDEYEE